MIKMYLQFKKGKQKSLMHKALKKAGSERNLEKYSGIPKSSIYYLKFEKRNLSISYALKLCDFLSLKLKDLHYDSILNSNWGQIKGGKELIKKKRKDGTFQETIERLKISSSKRMKLWHSKMMNDNHKKYYDIQHERFRKVSGGYPLKLKNGIKVRNKLEKEVGDFLISELDSFQYEPCFNVGGKAYFPDFLFGKIIIEVTEWMHPSEEKINNLKRKIKDYKRKGYRTCFFIPLKHRKFYKEIDDFIISDFLKLRKFINAPVA
jgi:hypothetical protein